MKVKFLVATNFGRTEYLPACDRSKYISEWLNKKHLSKKDMGYLKKIGLDPILLSNSPEPVTETAL